MDILEQISVQIESVEDALDGNETALAAFDTFLETIVAAVDAIAARVKSDQIYAMEVG